MLSIYLMYMLFSLEPTEQEVYQLPGQFEMHVYSYRGEIYKTEIKLN